MKNHKKGLRQPYYRNICYVLSRHHYMSMAIYSMPYTAEASNQAPIHCGPQK
uniref:Uncharacterized protein n=1 Tax=Nelumbo nucifera TaxID=4432 RepID=A0A822Y1D9_NELNU|nr:TPA_asm: hypothetical protein HUJ06_024931 [Nelumbo nucifera]